MINYLIVKLTYLKKITMWINVVYVICEEIKWKDLLKTYYLLYSLFLLLKLLVSIFYLYTGVKANTKGENL